MICEECLEPSADPVDGSRLDLCSRCLKQIDRIRAHRSLTPSNALGWTDDVHFTYKVDRYHCAFCSSTYELRGSMRKHLSGKHRDQAPKLAA